MLIDTRRNRSGRDVGYAVGRETKREGRERKGRSGEQALAARRARGEEQRGDVDLVRPVVVG